MPERPDVVLPMVLMTDPSHDGAASDRLPQADDAFSLTTLRNPRARWKKREKTGLAAGPGL